jgi:hypothetical protein
MPHVFQLFDFACDDECTGAPCILQDPTQIATGNTPDMLQSQCNRQHAVQRAAKMSEVAVHHRDRLDRGTHAGCTGPRESLDRIGAFIRKQIGAPAPALPADGIADLSTVSPR